MWRMRRRRALAEAPVRCYLAFLAFLARRAVRLDASGCNSSDGLQEFYIDNSTGVKVLHDALNCSSGGQFKAFWAGSVAVNESLAVGAEMSLTVIGEPGAEAVGSFGSRIFDVSQGGILNVSQLRLTAGLDFEGGAIFSENSTIILDNCKLDNNMAILNGGGLFASGGEVIIVGGEFTGNAAIAPDVQATFQGSGGAIYTMDANLTIRDHAQFESNWAMQGGAVFCGASSPQFDHGNVSCLLEDSYFSLNEATLVRDFQSYGDGIVYINHHGGGAVYILHAAAEVTGCTFEDNRSDLGGGALFGQVNTSVDVRSCVFRNNHTPGFGGAVVASNITVEGSIMEGNTAKLRGGAIYGSVEDGAVYLRDVTCDGNNASESGDGGCLYASGVAEVLGSTTMHGNGAGNGGCIFAGNRSDVLVSSGSFRCSSSESGGFLYAWIGASVRIEGGLVEDCVAEGRGGAVFCWGEQGYIGSDVIISGGTFHGNHAGQHGGVLYVLNTVARVTGGDFFNNSARYDGGFLYLDRGSFSCKEAMIRENEALDWGGAVLARFGTHLNLSCDIMNNTSPSGAAMHVSYVDLVMLSDMVVAGNVFTCGSSAIYADSSNLVATNVTIAASEENQEGSGIHPLRVEGNGTFTGRACTFDDWKGETIVLNLSPSTGSLTLDDCDFTTCSPLVGAVTSTSLAVIRNARISERTFELAGDPSTLVDQALSCADVGVCGNGDEDGDCVDAALGVLCECSHDQPCFSDGPVLNMSYVGDNETYVTGEDVAFEIILEASPLGTSDMIWYITHDVVGLELDVVPFAGMMSPGESFTVKVSGGPVDFEAGGSQDFRTTFVLKGIGTRSGDIERTLEVDPAFHYCDAFQFATLDGEESSSGDILCQQCLEPELDGHPEGVDCQDAGATFASLLLRDGFWRESGDSSTIHACLTSGACRGGKVADEYCNPGHEGPYCAVCTEGHGQGPNGSCYACRGQTTVLTIIFSVIMLLIAAAFVMLALVYLVGGLDALGNFRRAMGPTTGEERAKRLSGRGGQVQGVAGTERRGVLSFSGRLSPEDLDPTVIVHVPERGEVSGAENMDASVHIHEPRRLSESITRMFLPPAWPLGVESAPVGPLARDPSSANAHRSSRDQSFRSQRGPSCCSSVGSLRKCISRIPFDKLRILVVVWQILTVYPSVAGIEYPPVYAQFLNWIDVVNLNLGRLFSASCLAPGIGHYETLMATTLGPLVVGLVLLVTYNLAMQRVGLGTAGMNAARSAWARHVSAGLLVSFLVFTSTSTTIFRTFACDRDAVEGEAYLRADYRISCETTTHLWFEIYAGLMLLIYPFGIPVMYAYILWINREHLNPEGLDKGSEQDQSGGEDTKGPEGGEKEEEEKEGAAAVEPQDDDSDMRLTVPGLAPYILLWKDYCPALFYYEVIECGRRILLTGALVFIMPNTTEQAAIACLFAFGSLLGFELLRPHMDHTDSWLYRLGCVVIFMSNFLALLIKVNATESRRQDAIGVLLVILNVGLFLAVAFTAWIAREESVVESSLGAQAMELANTVMMAERLAGSTHHEPRRTVDRSSVSERVGRSTLEAGRPRLPPKAPASVATGMGEASDVVGTAATAAVPASLSRRPSVIRTQASGEHALV